MQGELAFSCACGSVTGTLIGVGPVNGDHVMCHCTDCQNFARYLGCESRILQMHGGTDLYQSRCAKMRLTKGTEKLACLHMTSKPTLRWYATCCRTPMFNTYANGRVPYITTFVANCDQDVVSNRLGPIIGHLFLPNAVNGLKRMGFIEMMGRCLFGRMIKDIVSGDRRRSALFDAKTFEPISTPLRLADQARG